MKYISIIFLMIFMSGCVTTTVPAKSEYRIKTNEVHIKSNAVGCNDKSLKVAQAFSSSALVSNNMSYALGDSKQFIYSESLWAQSPNSVITSKFLELIRAMDLFKSVQISKSRSRNDVILEVSIEDFMQYFNADSSKSHANVSINLTLIDIRSNRVFATKTFHSEVDILSLNAEGGVKGLSKGLTNILNNTNTWLSGVCK